MIFGNLPSEIENKLYEFSDQFFSQDLNEIKGFAEKKLDTQYAVSNEYLAEMKSRPDNVGFPEEAYGYDFKAFRHSSEWNQMMQDLDKSLMSFTGSNQNALKMYYPEGGYIGWHNNANAPGYNVLFTYSETGEGDFRYINPVTGELVVMPDIKGWSLKVGYYDTVKGNPLWHAAWTNCNRLNWGYVIHPVLWDDFANEIGVSRDAICEIIGRNPEELIEAYERGYR